MTEKFNIDEFINTMIVQANALVPIDIEQKVKDFITLKIDSFSRLGYCTLENSVELNLSDSEKSLLLQLIAETVFYKTIDLSISKIPSEYWESILQRLAFYVFELSKEYKKVECDFEEAIIFINWRVEKVYKETLQELFNKKRISHETLDSALAQSYAETMSEDTNIKLVQSLITKGQYNDVAEFVVKKYVTPFEIDELLETGKINTENYNKLLENSEYQKCKEEYEKECLEALDELQESLKRNPIVITKYYLNLISDIFRGFINKFRKGHNNEK